LSLRGAIRGLRPIRGRGLAAWGFYLALIAVSGYGISLARQLNSDLKAKTASELASTLVELFENSAEELSREWLADISAANNIEDLHKIELRLREESELFDALYVWSKGETSGQFEHPRLTETNDTHDQQIQNCLSNSTTESLMGLGLGAALSLGQCIESSPYLRLSTAIYSAEYFIGQNRAQDALLALDNATLSSEDGANDSSSTPHDTTAIELTLTAEMLRAQALILQDQPAQALQLLSSLTREIENQNGAALQTLAPMLQAEVIPLIASVGDMNSIRAATQISSAVQRRLLGYKELTRRMDQDAPSSTSPLATA
jgi:hypothetical protein